MNQVEIREALTDLRCRVTAELRDHLFDNSGLQEDYNEYRRRTGTLGLFNRRNLLWNVVYTH